MQAFEEARKPTLRKIFRTRRRLAFEAEPSLQDRIRNQVRQEIRQRHREGELPQSVGLYWPLPGEVDLSPLRLELVQELGLSTALPVADGQGNMTFRPWTAAPLASDGCGIPAPLDQKDLSAEKLSLLLVPALAVDRMGIRLGYGGGYYDRLRCQEGWSEVPALVVLPEDCVSVQSLPTDPWDRPFQGWLSEKGFQQTLP
ncbi:5-formyltetrahydrofolate cyclo-ligase family protein [Synechococcus sp. MIT S9509]|uniref:5-formyltetrahydrofolate cyclo-ligase n=1 Tax=unclassified Synechococcus TaxID=2626047 RepID=UPI0007BC3BB1|nr:MULTISPECIES: 5-formyltetrahydrofolate cyclo-ligase [unclassified Synechococcus]KZR85146.1 5-formyltetrahydrofolate cyclo-ligase family protein [Synechococcus sp. MIT S9504]KZR91321.1 5-formyltetrahydrofolate cyclo-ligase family protein [Synechococcus sp. MIT S9509]